MIIALQRNLLTRLEKIEPADEVAHVLTDGVYHDAAGLALKLNIIDLICILAGDLDVVHDASQQYPGDLACFGVEIDQVCLNAPGWIQIAKQKRQNSVPSANYQDAATIERDCLEKLLDEPQL